MTNAEKLKQLFAEKKAHVGVIGMGYVGIPMAHLAASQGFKVTGIEVDADRVRQINEGISYIQDVPTDELKPLVERGLMSATTDYEVIKDIDVVLITVPTPLGKTGDPDMSYVVSALESLQPYMHAGMLIVLESTTYPGTTQDLMLPKIQASGLKEGEDIFVAFSPERVDPGNPIYGTKNTPKVVGGMTKVGTEVACAYYEAVVDSVVPVSSATTAEMVKLYENTFRAINIGLVNELAIICNLLGTDVWEMVDAAATKPFGFMPFYPGPGLGGHCIPIDPNYLSWRMRSLHYKTRFIDLATELNTKMPEYVVLRAMELLNDGKKALNGAKIMLLGMAYKNEIDDLRESPALDVYELLVQRGADVVYHDPYCPQTRVGTGVVSSVELTEEAVADQDLIIITTGHKSVDYKMIAEKAQRIFDTRNVMRDVVGTENGRVVYL